MHPSPFTAVTPPSSTIKTGFRSLIRQASDWAFSVGLTLRPRPDLASLVDAEFGDALRQRGITEIRIVNQRQIRSSPAIHHLLVSARAGQETFHFAQSEDESFELSLVDGRVEVEADNSINVNRLRHYCYVALNGPRMEERFNAHKKGLWALVFSRSQDFQYKGE